MATTSASYPAWVPKAAAVAGLGVATALVLRQLRLAAAKEGGAVREAGGQQIEGASNLGAVAKEKQKGLVAAYVSDVASKLDAKASDDAIQQLGDLGKFMAFKDDYQCSFQVRPDVGEGQLLKVTDWYRLTPEDYDRTTFHVEVDVTGTSIEHLVNGADGKALSVYAVNDAKMVSTFIEAMGLNPHQVVSVEEIAPQEQEGTVVLTTVEKLMTQYLDIFGKPTREFLKKLVPFAHDIMDKVGIAEMTLERKTEEFQNRQARAYTYADYLTEFKSLRIPAEKYTELIPTVKQRVYSICSSSDLHPGKCQLLVVREDWEAKGGDTKFGLCSSFLTFMRPGNFCLGHSTHSSMKLPEDKMAHIFMAGLGTGLAPFRAFVEQRKSEKTKGAKVGPMTLFFGGRYSKQEYYYRDEFEAYEAENLVKCCNAWSRDTPGKKVYVQHKIQEEEEFIWEQIGKPGSKGYFFLCGSKQPEKDVYRTLLGIMQNKGNMSETQAQKKMEALQAAGRYVTEVY